MTDDDFTGGGEPSRGGCREPIGSGDGQVSPAAQECKSKKVLSLRANYAMDNLLHALGVEGSYFRKRTRPRGGSIP
jgi:hypothetical protein